MVLEKSFVKVAKGVENKTILMISSIVDNKLMIEIII